VVSLGDLMAHAADAGFPGTPFDSAAAVSAMGVLQLNEADLAKLLEDTEKDIARMAGALGAGAK